MVGCSFRKWNGSARTNRRPALVEANARKSRRHLLFLRGNVAAHRLRIDPAIEGDPDAFFASVPEKLLVSLETVGAGTGEVELVAADPVITAEEGPTFDFGIEDYGGDADMFDTPTDDTPAEEAHEIGEVNPEAPLKPQNLLDRLFTKAVLPRYAFPTDVVSFTVFDPSSTAYRAEIAYSPQAGLTQALSQ